MVDDSRGGRAKDPHASADDNPFGFLADLLQNLGKFCEPQSETSAVLQPKNVPVPVDRVLPPTGTEKTPRRFLDESPALPPDDDSAETMTPADMAFVPYVKPGVKIVMPSEAKKRRASLTPIAGSITPSASFDENMSETSSNGQSSVPPTGQFMMMGRRGSSHSVHSAHSAHSLGRRGSSHSVHSAHSAHSHTSGSHGSQTPRSPTAIADREETISYAHRRRQSYTDTMQEKSLGSRLLKATGRNTTRGTRAQA